MAISQNTKRTLKWLAVATTTLIGFEGLSLVPYDDPSKILTYCVGETQNADPSMKYTKEQCVSLLQRRLIEFNAGLDRCLQVHIGDSTRIALISFSYNVGTHALCNSSLMHKLNHGDGPSSCDDLLRWTYSSGKQLPGLVKRRQTERELCIDGFKEH